MKEEKKRIISITLLVILGAFICLFLISNSKKVELSKKSQSQISPSVISETINNNNLSVEGKQFFDEINKTAIPSFIKENEESITFLLNGIDRVYYSYVGRLPYYYNDLMKNNIKELDEKEREDYFYTYFEKEVLTPYELELTLQGLLDKYENDTYRASKKFYSSIEKLSSNNSQFYLEEEKFLTHQINLPNLDSSFFESKIVLNSKSEVEFSYTINKNKIEDFLKKSNNDLLKNLDTDIDKKPNMKIFREVFGANQADLKQSIKEDLQSINSSIESQTISFIESTLKNES